MYVNAARPPKSSAFLEATCQRWVSFINLEVERPARPREDDYKRQYLENLLGKGNPEPGTFIANGSTFHVVEGRGIWRLRSLALTVVSARGARISATFFRDWVLTDGLTHFHMPWDSKIAWLARFMDQEMIQKVIKIIEEMLEVDNPVWQEAAYHLSRLLCDSKASDLQRQSQYQPEVHSYDTQDRCQWVDWRENPSCFECSSIPLRRKAFHLAKYAIDPDFEPPDSVADELKDWLREEINADDRERLSPAFVRWLPHEEAQSWLRHLRGVDTDIDYETGSDAEQGTEQYTAHQGRLRVIHYWADHHRHILPLLRPDDIERLLNVWQTHVVKPQETRQLQQRGIEFTSTEIALLRTLLAIADPETCIELVSTRPASEGSANGCLRVLPMGLSEEQSCVCWGGLLLRPDQELVDKLQLLALDTHELDQAVIDRLILVAEAKDEWAVEVASFAQLSGNGTLMKALIAAGVGLMLEEVSHHYATSYNIPTDIPIEYIIGSASPGFVSGIMEGRSEDDFRKFAQALPEFVRSREYVPPNGKNRWWFSSKSIGMALELEPAVTGELLRLSKGQEGERYSPLAHSQLLYVAVCDALFASPEKERGFKLLDGLLYVEREPHFLGTTTSKPSMDVFRLMAANSSLPEVAELLEKAIDTITDDDGLQQLSLFFLPGEDDWLWGKVERDANSGRELFLARAFTIAGFAHDVQKGREFLEQFEGATTDWAENVRVKSLASTKMVLRAQFWFSEFLSRPDAEESWAAFGLLIRCLDKRFDHWHRAMVAESGLDNLDSRMVFFRVNRRMIDSLIEEDWKKNIKEHFCHTKVTKGIFPWMGGWSYPASYDRDLVGDTATIRNKILISS